MHLSALLLADVSSSFQDIAKALAGYAPGIFAAVLIVLGYLYMGTMDDAQKAMRVKEGIHRAVIGLVIVQLGVSVVLTLTGLIK